MYCLFTLHSSRSYQMIFDNNGLMQDQINIAATALPIGARLIPLKLGWPRNFSFYFVSRVINPGTFAQFQES
jgi:hypothetical protein